MAKYKRQIKGKRGSYKEAKSIQHKKISGKDIEPDWKNECMVCGAKPILPATGMCGPCTFGEADTAGGDW